LKSLAITKLLQNTQKSFHTLLTTGPAIAYKRVATV